MILPESELRGSLQERFRATWQSVLAKTRAWVIAGGQPLTRWKDGFEVMASSAILQGSAGRTFISLYMAAAEKRAEGFLFLADSQMIYERYAGEVNTLIETTSYAGLSP